MSQGFFFGVFMNTRVATLTIEMAASVARLQADMDKARTVVEGAMGRISSVVDGTMRFLGVAGAGLSVAGLVAMVKQASDAAREIERLSQVANTGTSTLQAWSYGARTVGVQQDKLADILKDVNDKVGEFVAVGGGPLKDFFEQVAPKVGVTADQFARLGGPEALQLYVRSLERAGLSQQQMTFYMEALASDSTLLLPLLKDGAQAMNSLALEADALGVVMSENTIAQSVELARMTDVLTARMQGFRNVLASELVPTLVEVATQFQRTSEQGTSFAGFLGGSMRVALETVSILGMNVAYVFQAVGDTVGAYLAVWGRLVQLDIEGARTIGEEWRKAGEARRAALIEAETRIMFPGAIGMTDEEKRKRGLLPTPASAWNGTAAPSAASNSAGAKAAREAAAELKAQEALYASVLGVGADYVEQLKRIEAMRDAGRLTDEQANAQLEKLISLQPVAGEQMRAYARWLDESAQANDALYEARLRAVQAAQDEVKTQLRANEAIGLSGVALAQLEAARQADAAAEFERQALRYDEINAGMAKLYRDQAKALRELASARVAGAAKQEMVDAAKATQEAWNKTWDDIGRGLSDALMRGFEDGESFGKNFVDSLENMIKTQIARSLQNSIASGLSGLFGGGSGGGFNLGGITSLFGGDGFSWSKLAGLFGGGGGASAGALTGDAIGKAYMQGLQEMAASTGATAGTSAASSWMSSAAGYAGWVGLALAVGSSLYDKGYNRQALQGEGKSFMYDSNLSPGMEKLNRQLFSGLGMSDKWADILSGTTRMATLFGRRLSQQGLYGSFDGAGGISTSEYAYYKGGLFRSNKTKYAPLNDGGAFEAALREVQNGAALMASSLGLSAEAVMGYADAVKIDLKGLSAEEATAKMQEEMVTLQAKMLATAEVAGMSAESFTQTAASMAAASVESDALKNALAGMGGEQKAFNDAVEKYKELIYAAQEAMASAGITAQALGDVLLGGMTGRLTEAQVGEQLADIVLGGIYDTIASPFADQIASAFQAQIVQPIFTAIMAGAPIAGAVSQSAIASVVATAQNAAAQLKAIFSNEEFQAAVREIYSAISQISSIAVAPARALPRFNSAVKSTVSTVNTAADQIKRAFEGIVDSLTDEIRRLRGNLLGETDASAQSWYWAQFATLTAQARAGNQDAANQLTDVSRTLEEISRATAASRIDLDLTQARLIESLAETRRILAARYGISVPAFATGTNYVTQDMLAYVHKGEAIVPRAYNPAADGAAGGSADMVAVLQALRQENALLRGELAAVRTATEQTAQDLRDAVKGRVSISTTVEAA